MEKSKEVTVVVDCLWISVSPQGRQGDKDKMVTMEVTVAPKNC